MLRASHGARRVVAGLAGIAILGAKTTVLGESPPAPPPARTAWRQSETPRDPWRRPPGTTSGPAARPQVGSFTSVQVNVAPGGNNIFGDAANEPSIAVDPTNPNHIAIGWRQFDDVLSDFRQAGWAFSQDGGRTWTFPGVLTPGVFRSDPVLGYDASGRFYYSSLTVDGGMSCDLFVSMDGGRSWLGPNYAYGGDKQWIAVDRSGGIGHGNIYSSWSTAAGCCGTATFTRSTDGGWSFMYPMAVPSSPRWGSMDVGPDGAVYVAGAGSSRMLVAKSTTAQYPQYMPFFDFVSAVNLGGGVVAGTGWTSPNPAGLLGQVWVAVDPSSGPTAGWVYLLCSVDPPGADPMDVMFARSTNGGLTWSAPVRVNDDAAGSWQWFATMSVGPNGRIDAVWNDTRSSGVANISQLFYSSSSDGGTTWSPNTALSPQWNSHVGFPNQNKIGDYYHMISDRVGADLAWAATFNGEQDVWFLRIGDRDCNDNGVGDATDITLGTSTDWNYNGIPDECEGLQVSDAGSVATGVRLMQNVPNPFHPATSSAPTTAIAFEMPSAGGSARVQIYDVAGRLVRTLGGAVVAGRNSVAWDGTDARGEPVGAGVYIYRLVAPNRTDSRRLVLVR